MSYKKRIADEIEHGKKISDHPEKYWRWEGPIGSARYARRVLYLSQSLKKNVKCLEIGCGTGLFTHSLAKTGANITAIDLSQELLKRAKTRVPGATFIQTDACHTNFADASYDIIVGSSILHHLELRAGLREIYRLLRAGGCLRFTEPNLINPHVFLQKTVPFIKEKMGDSKYETAFIRWPLAVELKRAGFVNIHIEPFDFLYPFFPSSWLNGMQRIGRFLERIPILKEIAGSLQITAIKPIQKRRGSSPIPGID